MSESHVIQPHLFTALGQAVAAYHPDTFEHSVRVGVHARGVAEVLALGPEDVELVGWAGLLHDIGKLGVPERILSQSGQLHVREWELVRRHATAGANVLEALSPDLRPLASVIACHHEHWDGSGYPHGLRGDEIPVLGRILALTDVYDSLTHARPYRHGRYSPGQARHAIERGQGTHFDPALVEAFVTTLAPHREREEAGGASLAALVAAGDIDRTD